MSLLGHLGRALSHSLLGGHRVRRVKNQVSDYQHGSSLSYAQSHFLHVLLGFFWNLSQELTVEKQLVKPSASLDSQNQTQTRSGTTQQAKVLVA